MVQNFAFFADRPGPAKILTTKFNAHAHRQLRTAVKRRSYTLTYLRLRQQPYDSRSLYHTHAQGPKYGSGALCEREN